MLCAARVHVNRKRTLHELSPFCIVNKFKLDEKNTKAEEEEKLKEEEDEYERESNFQSNKKANRAKSRCRKIRISDGE